MCMNEEMKGLNNVIKSLGSMSIDTMGITGKDLLKVMELKTKLDEDPNYDFMDEVPKSVHNILQAQANTAGGKLDKGQERDLLVNGINGIGSNGELQKEFTQFRSEIQSIHQAYLDSFEMTRLMDIIKNRGTELDKVLSKEKLFKRGCQDIDYLISEKYHITTMQIMKGFERAKTYGLLGDNDACTVGKTIMAALIVYTKDVKKEDKSRIWFIYNSMRNILSFLYHTKANKYTDQTKEAILKLFSAYVDEHNAG